MPANGVAIDISRNYASVSQCPSQRSCHSSRNTSRRDTLTTRAMSEDRPADDQGDGVESAVRLSSDALAELVRLLAGCECYGEANGTCADRSDS